jgi:glycosyltransferase involved in cell wall biosynthesis
MSCGAPIVTSNTTSMPGTCGDAALYFDPTEVTGIANSMVKVSNDEGIRNNLSRTSLARVEQFPDFTEANQRTADIIKELARGGI